MIQTNSKCYRFEKIIFNDGLLSDEVNATYILHLENNGRYESIMEQLTEYHPTNIVYICYNKGYANCEKAKYIDASALDLVDANLHIFKHAKDHNYDNILVLEDDFIFDKQIKDVWKLPAIAPWEKSCGKHPTQKPLSVLTRLILASTKPNAWILDPFTGSSTTGIAANLANRRFLGIDQEEEFLTISKNRKLEIENPKTAANYRQKIGGFNDKKELELFLVEEPQVEYGNELHF